MKKPSWNPRCRWAAPENAMCQPRDQELAAHGDFTIAPHLLQVQVGDLLTQRVERRTSVATARGGSSDMKIVARKECTAAVWMPLARTARGALKEPEQILDDLLATCSSFAAADRGVLHVCINAHARRGLGDYRRGPCCRVAEVGLGTPIGDALNHAADLEPSRKRTEG